MASFTHLEIFPIIARLIIAAYEEGETGFIEHQALVSKLLADTEGSFLVTEACEKSKLKDDSTVASAMIAGFSQRITLGQTEWSYFFEREQRNGVWAYRQNISKKNAIGDDPELSAIEGEVRMFLHFRRERKRAMVDAKRAITLKNTGKLACEACGVVTAERYPGLNAELSEVHHRIPLADAEEIVETRLEDLALLCPNCHRAIHRTKPMKSVEEFKAHFFARPKDILE